MPHGSRQDVDLNMTHSTVHSDTSLTLIRPQETVWDGPRLTRRPFTLKSLSAALTQTWLFVWTTSNLWGTLSLLGG